MSRKRLYGCGVSAALALALAAYAEPQETVTFENVISDGLYGDFENLIVDHAFTGTYVATKIRINGTLSSVVPFTWPVDARIEVVPPDGNSFSITPFNTIGSFTVISTPGDLVFDIPVPVVANGTWMFRFYEDYEDGDGPDAIWNIITIRLDDGAPPPPPPPATFPEVEPNDDKFSATNAFGLVDGDTLGGLAMGDGPDYFRVKTAPAPLGVYRHRLVLASNTSGNSATIRGLSQTNGSINFGTDVPVQFSTGATSPPHFLQWYGFGKEEELFIAIEGTVNSIEEYRAHYSVEPVTVLDAGTFIPGDITITAATGNTADLDFLVYDANFNAIPGYSNDGGDTLTRNFTEGTYYIAFSNFNTANDQASPPDDTFPSENVMDFPNSVVNSSTTIIPNKGIRITDLTMNSVETPASKDGPFDVIFFRMEVAPPTGPTNPVVIGSATPATFFEGGTTTITGTVFGGFNPPSTGLAVTADLSSIGGSSNQPLFDDGTNGDAVAGDNIFSFTVTVQDPGQYTIPLTVTDDQLRSNTASATFRALTLTELGTLDLNSTYTSPLFDLENSEVRWFRFTVPAVDNVSQTWLDIWTSGPIGDDTEIGLYNSSGFRVANDDQDGDGNLSALSFGLNFPPRPAIGNGVAFDGRDGNLPAGTYYLAVGMWPDTIFNDNDFNVISTGHAAFGVEVNINLGQPTPTGACCFAGACFVMTQDECALSGGSYSGDGTNCGDPTYVITETNEQFSSIAGFGNYAFTVSNCDDCTESVFLPFTFTFFGNDYNQVYISSNGNVQFGPSVTTAYLNDAIPSPAIPNNAIYPLWDDYNPSQQGEIYYFEDGFAPNRRFIIEWNNVTQYTALNAWPVTSENFQVILHEGTNNIEFRYGLISPVDTSGNNQGTGQDASGGDRTIGVEDTTGFVAYSVPSATHTGQGLLFTYVVPPSPCGPTCGTADFDGDGDVGTDADIESFFACLAGNCCPTCHPGGADFDGDGDTGTDADIEAFFRVLAGGNC